MELAVLGGLPVILNRAVVPARKTVPLSSASSAALRIESAGALAIVQILFTRAGVGSKILCFSEAPR